MSKMKKLLISTLLVLVCGQVGAEEVSFDFDVKDGYASQYTSYCGKIVNVRLFNRTFTAGEWTGVCFPFSATKEQLDDAFGEGKYTLEQFTNFDGNTISFSIMQTPAVVAGTPYILKVNTTVENPTFNGVTFASSITDGWMDQTVDETLMFRGYYFIKESWQLVNSQSSPTNAYWISATGTLQSYLANEIPYVGDGKKNGTYAFFFTPSKGNVKLTLKLEQPSGGNSGGEGGEGGGEVTPDLTTLEGKIAARAQLTDAPTIYIDIPNVTNLDSQLYKDRSTGEAPYYNATIKVIATDDKSSPHYLESFEETNSLDMEIKVRGNSTSAPSKRPYRLRFSKKSNSSDGKAHKHDLLGNGYSKRNWVLLANYFDRTMLRNAITYHLGKALGMDFCPGYKFVDLVINDEYRGTYQVSDHVEVDADRINVNEDTGWYIEAARGDMVEEPSVTAGGAQWSIKNPEYDTEEETNQLKQEVTDWLTQWGNSISQSNPNLTSKTKGWRAYSDEDSFVKFYLGINISGDYDGFMTVKAYREADGKLFLGPLWDKDLAFGNYTGAPAGTLVDNIENGQLRYTMRGLMGETDTQASGDPLFVKKLKEKMDEIDAEKLANDLCAKVDELAELIKNTRELNYQKWAINSTDQTWGTDVSSTDYQEYIKVLKDYLKAQIPFVKKHVDDTYERMVGTPASATYDPENPWYDQKLTTGKIVNQTVVNRQLKGGQWNTFCMPFSATQEQMEAALGCKYELKVHSGMAADGETMLFTAPESLDIEAAFPYLIKPVSNVTSMVFNGVLNTDGANQNQQYNGESVTFDNKHYFFGTLFKASYLDTATDYEFANDVYTEGNTLSHFASDETSGARAFIRITDGSAVKISFSEEIIEPVVRTQLTDLPTLYIDTRNQAEVQPSSGEWVSAGIEVIDANGRLTPFTLEAGLTAAGNEVLQIRGRGTASWTNTEKKSYRIQFGKDDKDNAGNVTQSYKHYLLGPENAEGVVKKRNWVLLANAGDKTLVRNALTKEIGDAVGLPFTPGYCFVDLVLNGKYVGTYQVTEYLEADANRVNVDEDNGLLIQMTGSDDTDATDHLISGEDFTKPWLTIKNPDISKKQRAAWNETFNRDVYDFDGMWAATDGTGLDKESLVNWYIASEITGSYEALSSIYAYKDINATELSFGPLWNNESSYDNSAAIDLTATGLMNDQDDKTSFNGLLINAGKQAAWQKKLQELWKEPWFADAVNEQWSSLYADGTLTSTLTSKVDELAAIVNSTKSSQALNFSTTAEGGAGWAIAGQGIAEYSKNVTNTTYADEVTRLKNYLETRLPYLDAKFKEMAKSAVVKFDVTDKEAISKLSPYLGKTANVKIVNRGQLSSDRVNTLCLPFNMTETQVTEMFGDTKPEEFTQMKSAEKNVFHFEQTQTIEAGKGYIIKPASDFVFDEHVFKGVTIPETVSSRPTTTDGGFAFQGVLVPTELTNDGTNRFLLGTDNKLYYNTTSGYEMPGGRAFFILPAEALQGKTMTFYFSDDVDEEDGVVTHINGIVENGHDVKIYNLNGQFVGSSWQKLPRGVYVVNGKKMTK